MQPEITWLKGALSVTLILTMKFNLWSLAREIDELKVYFQRVMLWKFKNYKNATETALNPCKSTLELAHDPQHIPFHNLPHLKKKKKKKKEK